MSWNDFLPQLATEHEVLESLFVEIGTPEEERTKQCQALFDKIMETMSERIDMVRRGKAGLEVEIDRMLESLGTLADLLGQDGQGVEQVIQAMQGMVSILNSDSDFRVYIVLEPSTDHSIFSCRLSGIGMSSFQANTA